MVFSPGLKRPRLHVQTPQMKASVSEARIIQGDHMSKGLLERKHFWGLVKRKTNDPSRMSLCEAEMLKQIITTVGLKTRETYSLPILEARSLLSRYPQGCVPSQGCRSGLASQFLRLVATLACRCSACGYTTPGFASTLT